MVEKLRNLQPEFFAFVVFLCQIWQMPSLVSCKKGSYDCCMTGKNNGVIPLISVTLFLSIFVLGETSFLRRTPFLRRQPVLFEMKTSCFGGRNQGCLGESNQAGDENHAVWG